MNDELKERMLQSMDKIEQWVRESEEFAREQAPLVVEEIIRWGIVHAALGIVLGVLILAIAGVLGWMSWNAERFAERWDCDYPFEVSIPCNMAGGIAVLIGMVVISINVYGLAYVYTAPRLYVIQQISGLM